MKPFITALLLMAGTLSPVGAANWIPLPASESAEVDTDSYIDSGVRASMDLKLSLDGTSVISTMEFDKDRRTYHIAAVKTLAADGSIQESTRFSDDSWSPCPIPSERVCIPTSSSSRSPISRIPNGFLSSKKAA